MTKNTTVNIDNIFEINDLKNLQKNNFCLEMKNFYKNPDAVCKLLNKKNPVIHKWGEDNSLNTNKFIDCRHIFYSNEFPLILSNSATDKPKTPPDGRRFILSWMKPGFTGGRCSHC